MTSMMNVTLYLKGTLRAHTDGVTSIATPFDNSGMIISSSRDKSLIVWDLTRHENNAYGVVHRRLDGHSHVVQDVVLSSDGRFALSGSCDSEVRLWKLSTGTTAGRFVGHAKDVTSVAFSHDDRLIVSASKDKTIKLWNPVGECKCTMILPPDIWMSCVRFSPYHAQPSIITSSWDGTIKIWNLTRKTNNTLGSHSGYVNALAVSPDGTVCASGGQDGTILVWSLNKENSPYPLHAGSIIHALCFSPNRYWLCAATQIGIKLWDFKTKTIIEDLKLGFKADTVQSESARTKTKEMYCTCLNWSADGRNLFAGYTDGVIRVWGIDPYWENFERYIFYLRKESNNE